MYVALTRARNELAVVYPLHVYATRRGLDYSIDQLSRFLDRGVRQQMQRVVLEEQSAVPPQSDAGEADRTRGAPELDLRELMRQRFAK